MVTKIKRNVICVLSDQHNLTPKRVRDTRFVKNVRILTSAIAYHDRGLVDEVHHILNNSRVVPDVVSPSAFKPKCLSHFPNLAVRGF